MSIEQSIFLALYHEHKARTGHDVFTQRSLSLINCDVCLYLRSIKREYEELENKFYQEQAIKEVT